MIQNYILFPLSSEARKEFSGLKYQFYKIILYFAARRKRELVEDRGGSKEIEKVAGGRKTETENQ